MKWRANFVAGGLFLFFGLLTLTMAGSSSRMGADVDYEALAQKLVTQTANIKEGDLVLVTGGVRDIELLENIAVHVRKLGAFPVITLGSERVIRRYYDEVPAKYDSQTPEFALKLGGLVSAVINIEFVETPDLLADVPSERLAAVGKAFEPVGELYLKRNVKQVNLGNALYPTSSLAKQYDVSKEELAEIFWKGVNIDSSELQERGESIRAALASAKEIHLTNPNGTDLKFRVEGRPVFMTDGTISADDVRRGGAASLIWLPAGEVFLAPIPGTAEGKIVVDRQFYQGKEVLGLELTFNRGELSAITAESGLDPVKSLYDAAGPGKELFGYIDIGINPNVRLVPGSKMVAWMPSGMITVGIGNNTWAGGENNVSYGLSTHLPNSTLTVDGKVLVENGKLMH